MSKKLTADDLRLGTHADYNDVATLLKAEGFTSHPAGRGVNWRYGDINITFSSNSGEVHRGTLRDAYHAIVSAKAKRAAEQEAEATQVPEWMTRFLAPQNLRVRRENGSLIVESAAYPSHFRVEVPLDTALSDKTTSFHPNFVKRLETLAEQARTHIAGEKAALDARLNARRDEGYTVTLKDGKIKLTHTEYGINLTIPGMEPNGRITQETLAGLDDAETRATAAFLEATPTQARQTASSPEAVAASKGTSARRQ